MKLKLENVKVVKCGTFTNKDYSTVAHRKDHT